MCTIACLAVIYVPSPIEMWYHVLEFCMTFWPFSLPIMSMWSFFISPRITLIPFGMHFESCWYNLSDSGNFFVLFMYVPVNLMYLDDIGCHGNHCEGLLALNYNYDWCYPNLVTTFRSFLYLISSEKSRVKSQEREIKIACLAAIYVPFPIEVWCTEVWWPFDPPPPLLQ